MKDYVAHLREHGVRPHITRIDNRNTPGLYGRTTHTEVYRISQRKRKRVEELSGWLKSMGGLRKTRFIDQAKAQMVAFISVVTCVDARRGIRSGLKLKISR